MEGAASGSAGAPEAEGRAVLHPEPPDAPRAARLPGTGPVGADEWILRDAVFAEQMALRDRLAGAPGTLALRPEARGAAAELLDAVLARVSRDAGYRLTARSPGGRRGGPDAEDRGERADGGGPIPDAPALRASGPRDAARGATGIERNPGVAVVCRPDGVEVPVDRARPMATMARLVQEDLCLLQPGPEGHVLTAGALLFPSFWRLDEKLGRSLVSIHAPVEEYDADVARRVQRLFDAIGPGRPLCRWNWLAYDEPWLHQPRDEAVRREAGAGSPWLRRERQCLLRLPRTRAVVFSIHTFVARAPT